MNARKLVLLVAALVLATSGAAYGGAPSKTKMFKWVDKNGVTQYGSSIPPEYANQASEQLNSQGEVVKTQDAQKTPEQMAAAAQAQQQAAQQVQAQAAAKAHDKVLLDTYTSTADMERDRDSKLSAIDAQINVLSGSVAGLENSLAEYQSRAQDLASKGKPVPPDLQKNIDNTQKQLVANQQLLVAQQQRKQQVADQFKTDIERYKQLTGQSTATPPAH
jgi:chromosome segregation ATPase